MKKSLLLILIIAAFIYSCKKSSSSPVTIVGTWYVKTDSTASGGSPIMVHYYNMQNNYQFNADGSGRRNFYGGSNFTYKVVSNTIYFQYPAYTDTTATIPAHNDTCSIATLTTSKLSLISEYQTVSPGGSHYLVTEFQLCSK